MITSIDTPTRNRVVQGDQYPDDFAFKMPRPFNEINCGSLATELGINAAGLASQMNQVLAENLGNNLAQRVKMVLKHNAEHLEDQKPLPTQEDLDEIVSKYDFSGTRSVSTSVSEASMTALERIVYAYCRTAIRGILKEQGCAGVPAPVKIAKKETAPAANEISYEDFESLVADMAEGNGIWATSPAHEDARNNLIELAEAEYATKQKATQSAARSLTLEA